MIDRTLSLCAKRVLARDYLFPFTSQPHARNRDNTTMEFMSNLGGGLQADRPSLFELTAQDKMREMLEPALRYVIAVRIHLSDPDRTAGTKP